MDKTPDQKHADNIWGAVIMPVLAAWIAFHLVRHSSAPGWILYAVGVAAVLIAHGWFALRKKAPGVGGTAVPVLYALLGGLFWLTRT
ncbi:hypothetical protein ACWCWQ_19090 [Streptomyces sp. NPDC001571]